MFDALALISLAQAQADVGAAWNEGISLFETAALASRFVGPLLEVCPTANSVWCVAGDGWYGKLGNDDNWTPRPSAYLYQLLNMHMQGSLLPCAVAPYDFPTAGCMAAVGATNVTMLVVNRADKPVTLKVRRIEYCLQRFHCFNCLLIVCSVCV